MGAAVAGTGESMEPTKIYLSDTDRTCAPQQIGEGAARSSPLQFILLLSIAG